MKLGIPSSHDCRFGHAWSETTTGRGGLRALVAAGNGGLTILVMLTGCLLELDTSGLGTAASTGGSSTGGAVSGETGGTTSSETGGTTSGDTGGTTSGETGGTTSGETGGTTSGDTGGTPSGETGGTTSSTDPPGTNDECLAAARFDFESCPDGFSVAVAGEYANPASWACGNPTSGPMPRVNGVWATNLHGSYRSLESSALEAPSISLEGCDGRIVTIDITHWYQTEDEWDGGNFAISTDGGSTFETVEPSGYAYDKASLEAGIVPPHGQPGFNGRSATWNTSTIDLSPYMGEPEVRFRMVFGSDTTKEDAGWYVDSVEVKVQ